MSERLNLLRRQHALDVTAALSEYVAHEGALRFVSDSASHPRLSICFTLEDADLYERLLSLLMARRSYATDGASV